MLKKKKLAAEGENLVVTDKTPSIVSEQFRALRSNINFLSLNEPLRSLVITSAVSSEGRSTVTANLAAVYAEDGKKVLLVDSDLRKPSTHVIFQLRNNKGLSNYLTRQALFEEVIQQTFVDRLELITSGPGISNPAELLGASRMEELIRQAKDSYDIVIFDSPPLLAVADGQIVSNRCDASLLVINSGETTEEDVIQAKETLLLADSKLIGVILNNINLAKTSAKNL
ncbi:CpsD/CapB family tyrosine-protein kinase [Planococcus sp. 1R117A]|uniref:CpsD/CapB family tyrosine-protein kinase n=1 Tax=Planococcus sp. 1R117A TaxID=3447020 RepID=UPI003EDC1B65